VDVIVSGPLGVAAGEDGKTCVTAGGDEGRAVGHTCASLTVGGEAVDVRVDGMGEAATVGDGDGTGVTGDGD
jgi:hypothetical protein